MKIKLLVLGSLLIAVLTIGLLKWDMTDNNNGSGVQLERPSFVAVAAKAEEQEGVNFLQQEAGIAAYVKVNQAIDLEQVRGAFKTVETVSDEYIIGEVALPDLPEKVHPHVYVNKEGWIVAYYSKGEPASKIMQWRGYKGGSITTTTLKDAIRQIWDAFRAPFPFPQGLKYYDFEYPSANRIMLITETIGIEGTDSFYLKIPIGARLYEASWGLYLRSGPDGDVGSLMLDDVLISRVRGAGFQYGDLTNQLKRGFRHTVKANQGCDWRCGFTGVAIVLIYQV
jgi:hypothetical protein